jgi:hypothetical protein
MSRKKGRPINFDVIVKFFLRHYDIPTRKDVNRLVDRMDRLEKLIRASVGSGAAVSAAGTKGCKGGAAGEKGVATAADRVLAAIADYTVGAGFAEIYDETVYEEKKIRNIIYRLHKLGKIRRKARGVYVMSTSNPARPEAVSRWRDGC